MVLCWEFLSIDYMASCEMHTLALFISFKCVLGVRIFKCLFFKLRKCNISINKTETKPRELQILSTLLYIFNIDEDKTSVLECYTITPSGKLTGKLS